MENEKDPSQQEDLGDSKQEESDNDLEEAANQHEDGLREILKRRDEDYMELQNEVLAGGETIDKLSENIKILESTRIDSRVPGWVDEKGKVMGDIDRSYGGERGPVDTRKVYIVGALTELEQEREKLVRKLIHRRDDFQRRVDYAKQTIELREERQNAERKPAPAEDGADAAPAEPSAEPSAEAEEPAKE